MPPPDRIVLPAGAGDQIDGRQTEGQRRQRQAGRTLSVEEEQERHPDRIESEQHLPHAGVDAGQAGIEEQRADPVEQARQQTADQAEREDGEGAAPGQQDDQ
jgi:hypothetical protein